MQALRQVEAGTVVGEVCRKLGVTEATLSRWKKTYSGLDLHELREENRWLRQVAARSDAFPNRIARDFIDKK